jgi:hypothetical protein
VVAGLFLLSNAADQRVNAALVRAGLSTTRERLELIREAGEISVPAEGTSHRRA